MLEIRWSEDNRCTETAVYLVDPETDRQSRLKAFRKGWSRYLNGKAPSEAPAITWEALGMLYASSLGDIAEPIKTGIYRVLLSQFLASPPMEHCSNEQRLQALELVGEPPHQP